MTLGVTYGLKHTQKFDLYFNYMTWPSAKDQPFEYGSYKAGTLHLHWLIAGFFLLSGIFQLGPVCFWDSTWRRLTETGVQPFRWVEYSFSSSCLLLVAAALCGINDIHYVLLIFASTWTTMMLGLVQENTANYPRSRSFRAFGI